MKKYLLSIACVLVSVVLFAQGETTSEDVMTGHLKIYMVLTVLAIILSLIFIFLFSMERRLKELEKRQEN